VVMPSSKPKSAARWISSRFAVSRKIFIATSPILETYIESISGLPESRRSNWNRARCTKAPAFD
jgi:hypothetical protein